MTDLTRKILGAIESGAPRTAAEIAASIGRSRESVGGALRSMRRAGLVGRLMRAGRSRSARRAGTVVWAYSVTDAGARALAADTAASEGPLFGEAGR